MSQTAAFAPDYSHTKGDESALYRRDHRRAFIQLIDERFNRITSAKFLTRCAQVRIEAIAALSHKRCTTYWWRIPEIQHLGSVEFHVG